MTATRLHGQQPYDQASMPDTAPAHASMPGSDPAERDNPSAEFIRRMRDLYPVEAEIDRALTRKMEHRGGPPYQRVSIETMDACLGAMLRDNGAQDFRAANYRWMTGGVSKIQLAFDLSWQDETGPRSERMVIRMDPARAATRPAASANSMCWPMCAGTCRYRKCSGSILTGDGSPNRRWSMPLPRESPSPAAAMN